MSPTVTGVKLGLVYYEDLRHWTTFTSGLRPLEGWECTRTRAPSWPPLVSVHKFLILVVDRYSLPLQFPYLFRSLKPIGGRLSRDHNRSQSLYNGTCSSVISADKRGATVPIQLKRGMLEMQGVQLSGLLLVP
ncbi:hypothetical protein CGLO_05965 [Colletotrichum gloeosporioides Cg-14]|uniref:Uncharacterized protein n=1 Tax=Colletotrichum gloeosporioides (strain Cg-14) TaxID=1237896 RepID=T0LRA5_COLGC|nr:hypothetical protein CGLO_05965 [Colletotrichum gloeosporioides Cg-14]